MLNDPKKEAQVEEEIFHSNLTFQQKYLLDMAEVLKQFGWIQHANGSEKLGFCFYGASGEVFRSFQIRMDDPKYMEVHEKAQRALRMVADYVDWKGPFRPSVISDKPSSDMVPWNDANGRTRDEVIHTLQLVALGG